MNNPFICPSEGLSHTRSPSSSLTWRTPLCTRYNSIDQQLSNLGSSCTITNPICNRMKETRTISRLRHHMPVIHTEKVLIDKIIPGSCQRLPANITPRNRISQHTLRLYWLTSNLFRGNLLVQPLLKGTERRSWFTLIFVFE